MKYIFLHGLGQRADSWEEIKSLIGVEAVCPDLYDLVKSGPLTYEGIYKAFVQYCSKFSEPLHLAGLSLGGILALNYAIDYPERVASLVLIGAQYKIPKGIMTVQGLVFRLLPKSVFKKMGFDKGDFISLLTSTKDLDFSSNLSNIGCPTLILCGTKDKPNHKAALGLEKNIKNSVLKWVEGAGHVVNQDAPEVLAKLINEFYEMEESKC